MIEQVRQYVRERRLLGPGERVAVAVSGGADSVALLCALAELKAELGIVLSVAHFHHGIRGAEADGDQQFVSDLAERLRLEFHCGSADVPAYARTHAISIETAARELRHAWFAELVARRKADKVATAHTLDDQAETVLMRLIRGAGIRGLAGIFPVQQEKKLVRPLLAVTRKEVESYLTSKGQSWREDSSNLDLAHTRNRVRHQLLPMLERDFNPGIRGTLAGLAEMARGDSEYWDHEIAELLPRVARPGKPSRSGRKVSGEARNVISLDTALLTALPVAVERQLLHHVAAQLGGGLEFVHVEQLRRLAREKSAGKQLALTGGLTASKTFRELQLTVTDDAAQPLERDYSYPLKVPGEASVPELGSVIHARMIPAGETANSAYNSGALLNPVLLARELIVRNWRSGDRFFPAKTREPRKLKELLQPARLGRPVLPEERKLWPVIESAGQIVWVRGFVVPEAYAASSGAAVLIEESQLDVRRVVQKEE